MSIEKMRAEFEAAYREEALSWPHGTFDEAALTQTSSGDYRAPLVQASWWGWQASIAALVVELPEQSPETPFSKHMVMDSSSVIEAIEAAGIKIKE